MPQGLGLPDWECAWESTITAYGNVCFDEKHVGIEEMYRLRDELVPKLRGSVGSQTLVWIWEQLAKAQTGPHGKHYEVGTGSPSWIAFHRG